MFQPTPAVWLCSGRPSQPSNRINDPNAIPAGSTVSLALTCMLPALSLSSYASIAIETNAAPTAGKFTTVPSSGMEFLTPFMSICSHWIDEDLPLTYSFGFFISIWADQCIAVSQ
jgi:hypothetical protein